MTSASPPVSLDAYLRVRNTWQPSWSGDGRTLSHLSDETGVAAAWIARPDASRHRVSHDGVRVVQALFAPHSDTLVYSADTEGSELLQLYVRYGDGAHRAITTESRSLNILGAFSGDGQRLAFTSNAAGLGADFDVYVTSLHGRPTRLMRCSGLAIVLDWDPHGARLLVSLRHTNTHNDLLLVEADTGAVTQLTAHAGAARHEFARFDATGTSAIVATDRGANALRLARLDLRHRTLQTLTSDDWDVEDIARSPDGSMHAIARNVEGFTQLLLLDARANLTQVTDVPAGVWAGFSWAPDGRTLAFTHRNSDASAAIWTLELGHGTPVRRVAVPPAVGAATRFTTAELTHYQASDGGWIPALRFTPLGAHTAAVIDIHGGPEAQSRPYFDPFIQYLTACGYLVLQPNIRGSTGYGKAYAALDDGRLRPVALRDVVDAARRLRAGGTRRIGLMGASYGGLVVLNCLAEAPELFDAGVSIAGIANLVTFLERTTPFRRPHREAEYGSLANDRKFLENFSPVARAARIQAPVLLLHGENDPRVPVSEARQMAERLRVAGAACELHVYPGEGHGLSRPENLHDSGQRIARFLDVRLRPHCSL